MAISKDVTISEIAARADVSIATVSRVINQIGNTKAETKQRVFQAMSELGLNPNTYCGAKDTAGSQSILVCLPDFRNPFNADVIEGIQNAAITHGYRTFFYEASDLRFSLYEYEKIINQNNFCGLLLVHNVLDTDQLNKIKLKYPVVMCSEHCNLPDISFVSIDDVYSSQIAVNYLLSIGRTRIALINSQLTNAYARYREKGFLDALGKAGMQANNNWILHITEFDFDIAVSVITSLLKQTERPDALYCVSDVYGAAAIKAIQNFGLRVPEDIAVVGFDNIDLSKMVVPSLTTINQPKKQLGHQACEMLINLIENPSTPTQHILLDTELIVRSST